MPPNLSLLLLCAMVACHPIPSNHLGLQLSLPLHPAGSGGSHSDPTSFPTTAVPPTTPPNHDQMSNFDPHTSHKHSKRGNHPAPTSDKAILPKVARLQALVDEAHKEATSGTASITELEDMANELEKNRDLVVNPLSDTIARLYVEQINKQKAKADSQALQPSAASASTDHEATNTDSEVKITEGPSELERLTGHAAKAHSAYTDGLTVLTEAAKKRLPEGEELPFRFQPEVFSL
jgi:hypothetical protein